MTVIDDWISELNGNRISAAAQPLQSKVTTAVAALAAIQTALVIGPAGGDLAGAYPNPTVDGLQGRPIAAAAPGDGQSYKWNAAGSQFLPRSTGIISLQQAIASGTYTPNPLATSALAMIWGGGGGGGGAGGGIAANISAGGGGAGGTWGLKILTLDAGNLIPTAFVIGAGGTGGDTTGTTGGIGGNSTFGALIFASGGGGGVGSTVGVAVPTIIQGGSSGGVAGAGDFKVTGTTGRAALIFNGTVGASGAGGNAPFLARGQAGKSSSADGNAGVFCAGGIGGLATNATNRNGGAGGDGLFLVFEFA